MGVGVSRCMAFLAGLFTFVYASVLVSQPQFCSWVCALFQIGERWAVEGRVGNNWIGWGRGSYAMIVSSSSVVVC
jgi:hypothetical protein